MACQTNTKDDSIHHVWNFPWSVCLRVVFWCQCIWFGFLGPNWFDQTANQEQLCGLHVSLRDFFPLWSSWSLLHCSNTYNKASWWEDWKFWGNKINIIQIIDHSLRLLAFSNRVRCWTNLTFVHQRVSPFWHDLHLRLRLCLCLYLSVQQTNSYSRRQVRNVVSISWALERGRLFCLNWSSCSVNWIWVWLGWLVVFCLSSNFWTPIPASNHFSRKSSEAVEVTQILSSIWYHQFPSW